MNRGGEKEAIALWTERCGVLWEEDEYKHSSIIPIKIDLNSLVSLA